MMKTEWKKIYFNDDLDNISEIRVCETYLVASKFGHLETCVVVPIRRNKKIQRRRFPLVGQFSRPKTNK